MGRYVNIHRKIWNKEKFRSSSDDCKFVFFHVLTTPFGSQFGLFKASPVVLAEEAEWDLERYSKAFTEGFTKGFLKYDEKHKLIFIPNWLRYNPPNNPNVLRGWGSSFSEISDCDLKSEAYNTLKQFVSSRTKAFQEAFQEAFQGEQNIPKTKPLAKPLGTEYPKPPVFSAGSGAGTGSGTGASSGSGSETSSNSTSVTRPSDEGLPGARAREDDYVVPEQSGVGGEAGAEAEPGSDPDEVSRLSLAPRRESFVRCVLGHWQGYSIETALELTKTLALYIDAMPRGQELVVLRQARERWAPDRHLYELWGYLVRTFQREAMSPSSVAVGQSASRPVPGNGSAPHAVVGDRLAWLAREVSAGAPLDGQYFASAWNEAKSDGIGIPGSLSSLVGEMVSSGSVELTREGRIESPWDLPRTPDELRAGPPVSTSPEELREMIAALTSGKGIVSGSPDETAGPPEEPRCLDAETLELLEEAKRKTEEKREQLAEGGK
jgi:hypothetical protein